MSPARVKVEFRLGGPFHDVIGFDLDGYFYALTWGPGFRPGETCFVNPTRPTRIGHRLYKSIYPNPSTYRSVGAAFRVTSSKDTA